MLSAIIYFALVVIKKPKVAVEERNEILKTGGRLFWANLIITFFQNIQGDILVYDFFMAVVSASLTYVFYKIFVNGIAVIKDLNEKRAFTIEELISCCIIVAIATLVFDYLTIFNLQVSNIIIAFLIMVLGWKNGLLVGCTSGLSIGLVLSMIEQQNSIQMAVFAVCGILAGIFNKFGKIGVIVGFILGNSIIIYLSNGQSIQIVYFREIFVAALGLLFVPKNIKLELEDILPKGKLLSDLGENRLTQNDEMFEKINNISNTISEMVIEEKQIPENLAEEFKDILSQNLDEISYNIFYEDIIDEENKIIDDIYNLLLKNDIILEKDFMEILKQHNNYVVIQDETIKNDLQEMIKIINKSYKMLQIEVAKIQEKNKNISSVKKELKNISSVINSAVKESVNKSKFENKEKEIYELLQSKYDEVIDVKVKQLKNEKYIVSISFKNDRFKEKECIINIANILTKNFVHKIIFQSDKQEENYVQNYMSEDKYLLQIGCSKVTKDGSSVSGDCSLQMKLDDGKYLLAISDGMGSGKDARKAGKLALNTLEKLLQKGFDKDDLVNFINDSLILNTDSEMYATLDFSIIDLYKGEIKIAKNGASNSYIKNKKKLEIIKSSNIPVGIVEKANFECQTIKAEDGDILIMCSDGLLNYQNDFNENWVENYLKNITTSNVQKIADMIVVEAIDNNFGKAKDDITIIVAKIVKK